MKLQGADCLAVAEKPHTPESVTIGGVRHFAARPGLKSLPERYDIRYTNDMEELLNPESLLGTDEATIERQLKQKFVSPHPKLTHVYRFEGELPAEPPFVQDRWGYNRRQDDQPFDGWLILDRWYVDDPDDEALIQLTQKYGPILVQSEFVWKQSEEKLRERGFVLACRRFGLHQINFNPKRTSTDPYRLALKKYNETQRGFKEDDLRGLYACLLPQNAYGRDRFCSVRTYEDFSIYGIRELLDLSKLLWPEKAGWWRDVSTSTSYYRGRKRIWLPCKFKDCMASCLTYLRWEEQHFTEDTSDDRKWLCRFIRREAKAMKLKIPPKQKPPKKPGVTQRKRKKRNEPQSMDERIPTSESTKTGEGTSVETRHEDACVACA